MERLIEELRKEIKADTEMTFTVSDVDSLLTADFESKHTAHSER